MCGLHTHVTIIVFSCIAKAGMVLAEHLADTCEIGTGTPIEHLVVALCPNQQSSSVMGVV